MSFSLPALLSSVAVSPALWVLIVLLARQINGLAEIAIYNASRQWWMIVLFIPTVVGRTLLPILTERITIGDAAGVRKILVWSTGLVGGVAIPLALAATRFREPILSLFGDDFTSGGSTLVLMVWAAVLAAVQVPLAQTFAAANRLWLGLLTNIAWALVLLLTFLALGSIGARGIAISLTVAYGLHLVWTLVLVQVVLRRKIGSRTTGDSMYPSI